MKKNLTKVSEKIGVFLPIAFFIMAFFGSSPLKAQEVQDLESYIFTNKIGSSDNFSDLLYGGMGIVEIFEGKVTSPTKPNSKTLLLDLSELQQLSAALDENPSIEFIRINLGNGSSQNLNLNLEDYPNIRFILLMSPSIRDASLFNQMIIGSKVNPGVKFLYQFTRPG